MNNNYMSFVLTIISGLSTLFGFLLIFLKINDENKFLAIALSFASSIMIGVSIFDIMPEAFLILISKYSGICLIIISLFFILLGSAISLIISQIKVSDDSNLYNLGIISMIVLVLHNIPEGIATFITTNSNINLGIKMALAIGMHNIPEGISIAIPIYYATKSRGKAFLYTLIAALSEPLGGVISYLFLVDVINQNILAFLYLIIVGIMMFIALFKLLPSAALYNNKKLVLCSFIFGIIFIIMFH